MRPVKESVSCIVNVWNGLELSILINSSYVWHIDVLCSWSRSIVRVTNIWIYLLPPFFGDDNWNGTIRPICDVCGCCNIETQPLVISNHEIDRASFNIYFCYLNENVGLCVEFVPQVLLIIHNLIRNSRTYSI